MNREIKELLTPLEKIESEVDYLFDSDIIDIKNLSDRQNIVDSKTLFEKVKKCIKVIQKIDTSNEGKIKIADFICNKLSEMYKLSIDKEEIIINELTNAILNSENLPLPVRLYYLRFRNVKVSYSVSVKLFHQNIKDKIELLGYFQILKYILKICDDLYIENIFDEILDNFDHLFNDENLSIYAKMEIADIFLLNNRTRRGNEMVDQIRHLEYQNLFNQELQEENINNTVYTDSQNVHDTYVNNSVLKACIYLMEIEPPSCDFDLEKIEKELINLAPEYEQNIKTVVERIQIDTSRFTLDDNSFSLYNIFSSLWSYINKNSDIKEEFCKRLIEEIVLMESYCTTGHLTRLISVIQGFTKDEKLCIRISTEQQILAVLRQFLDISLKKADESVTDSLISDDKNLFYKFVITKINSKIPELLEEYGDIQEEIISAIRFYTNWDFWSIENKKLLKLIPCQDDEVEKKYKKNQN